MLMKTITLCGSTRFKTAFDEWNVRLTLEPAIVISVAVHSQAIDLDLTPDEVAAFAAIHLAKIDISDEIFVLDVGGYVGPSCQREIDYAQSIGKTIRRLSLEHPNWSDADRRYAGKH